MGQLVMRCGELSLGAVEPAFGPAQDFVGRVIVAPRGKAALEQRILPVERNRRLPQLRLGRADRGFRRGDVRLLLLRIDPRQDLVRGDVVPLLRRCARRSVR